MGFVDGFVIGWFFCDSFLLKLLQLVVLIVWCFRVLVGFGVLGCGWGWFVGFGLFVFVLIFGWLGCVCCGFGFLVL